MTINFALDQLKGKGKTLDIVLFEMLSERYHWTPDQIRDMRQDDILDYLVIIRAKKRIEKFNQKKNGRH